MQQTAGQPMTLTNQYFKNVEDSAFEFNAKLDDIDRMLRKKAITIPDLSTKQAVAAAYWQMFSDVEEFQARFSDQDLSPYKAALRAIISPWLCRSTFFWRAFAKPNGYAGDYKVIDLTYDLEHSAGDDPTEPGIVNCLNYIISTMHSVDSLWERRHWLSGLLKDELRKKNELKVLDIACGGARYIGDFLASTDDISNISITLLDQDPAALAFAELINLKNWSENISTICAPIKHLKTVLANEEYDVIISSGLFDYLNHETGSDMLAFLSSRLKTDGVIAITNFHKDDKSAIAKDWGSDWPLLFREDHHVEALFPKHLSPKLTRSQNGSLIMATGRKRSKN